MKNKLTPAPGRADSWRVSTARARAIQEKLRAHWEGRDRFGKIHTAAGLDASFILTGPQDLKLQVNPPLLLRKADGECIGTAVRTRRGVRPIYASQGHRISLATAIQWTWRVTDGSRIPRPTRDADHLAAETKRAFLAAHASEN
jgi:deoxyinosine 3'endonuclease (endonuclease V)